MSEVSAPDFDEVEHVALILYGRDSDESEEMEEAGVGWETVGYAYRSVAKQILEAGYTIPSEPTRFTDRDVEALILVMGNKNSSWELVADAFRIGARNVLVSGYRAPQTAEQTPTLGEIADVMKAWLDSGITLGAVEYVATQVFWSEVEERRNRKERLNQLR